jgi:hypothetical protein
LPHDRDATPQAGDQYASRPQRNAASWRPTCVTTATQRRKLATDVRHDRNATPQAGDRRA